MAEKQLALGSQAQAAGGAAEQANVQLLLQALKRSAGHRRGNVQAPGGGRQVAQVSGGDKQLQIIKTQHGGLFSKKY